MPGLTGAALATAGWRGWKTDSSLRLLTAFRLLEVGVEGLKTPGLSALGGAATEGLLTAILEGSDAGDSVPVLVTGAKAEPEERAA